MVLELRQIPDNQLPRYPVLSFIASAGSSIKLLSERLVSFTSLLDEVRGRSMSTLCIATPSWVTPAGCHVLPIPGEGPYDV